MNNGSTRKKRDRSERGVDRERTACGPEPRTTRANAHGDYGTGGKLQPGPGPEVAPRRRKSSRGEMFGIHPQRAIRAAIAADEPDRDTRETILLVEDEPAVRQLFMLALTRAGYRVFEARNGQEALKLFDQHGDSIDLLLTDLRMPYMGGAELAQHLRARRKTLKLIAISGYSGGTEQELKADFLAKPFSRDDLDRKSVV